jgi:hypothetical protein
MTPDRLLEMFSRIAPYVRVHMITVRNDQMTVRLWDGNGIQFQQGAVRDIQFWQFLVYLYKKEAADNGA